MTGALTRPEPGARVRVGLVQLRSGIDPASNIEASGALIAQAAEDGARLIVTPEATNIVQRDAQALRDAVAPAEVDPGVAAFSRIAGELGVWLVIGSLMVRASDTDDRVANRTYVFGPDGTVRAHYDKLHLFDVTVSDTERYLESQSVAAGDRAVVVDTPWGGLGLTICYDVRFPHLFRGLAKSGAGIIALPAAFTRHTGRAHWEVLVRARAIETGCYVLAPGQGGVHEDGRATWGRSMVVDPWGEIVGVLDHDAPGVVMADLDLDRIDAVRRKIPALTHDRPYAIDTETTFTDGAG